MGSDCGTHQCGSCCLGPLTFHPQARGDKIQLSQGNRLAERLGSSFCYGLVFSSRPVSVKERIRLRVEKDATKWQGALRVGFTNVPPEDRALPKLAIPDLTAVRGHWAAPVPELYSQAGSELEMWVGSCGSLFVASNHTRHKLLEGLDLNKPLWAMIDIYGQTRSLLLLGSEKKTAFSLRRSCPVPEGLTAPDADIDHSSPHVLQHWGSLDWSSSFAADGSNVTSCVVCFEGTANITLPCGHQCLCDHCALRVIEQFGTCPLCRQKISFSRCKRL